MTKKRDETEQVYSVEMSNERLEFCCGIEETGIYKSTRHDRYDRRYWGKDDRLDLLEEEPDSFFKSLTEAWQHELDQQRYDSGARPIIFTFVKYKYSKKFDEQELYDLVAAQPDHLFVHGFTNPGSGNYVEMWVLTNGSK